MKGEVSKLAAQQAAPSFIKIDVQGHEYHVLNGSRETLRRYKPVLLVESFRSDARTVSLMDGLGYEEYFFDGQVLREGIPMQSPNSFANPEPG